MKCDNGVTSETDTYELDERAEKALADETGFEALLREFKPFLLSRASRLAGDNAERREEMIHIANMAFYESVKSYNQQKGHFFQFMNSVVHKRLIDEVRKLYTKRVVTVPIENAGDDRNDSEAFPSNIDKASINVYIEDEQRYSLTLEIECFKAELSDWGITMAELAARSPKQAKLRAVYNKVVNDIADDAEIMRIILIKRYFPGKKIANLTKVPQKTVERGRIYIIASLIIRSGDYDYLKGYITGNRAGEREFGKGGRQ